MYFLSTKLAPTVEGEWTLGGVHRHPSCFPADASRRVVFIGDGNANVPGIPPGTKRLHPRMSNAFSVPPGTQSLPP